MASKTKIGAQLERIYFNYLFPVETEGPDDGEKEQINTSGESVHKSKG